MARIRGVSPAQAGLYVRIACHFTRRGLGKLAGREPERMLEPLEVYAHVPVLFKGYAKLEQATAKSHRLARRLRALAELKAATLTHCEYCIDLGSAISRRWGLTDDEILALPRYQASPLFSELDKLVLDYAVGMSRTLADVPDELFGRLRQHLDDAQLVELTHFIALENMRPLQPGVRHRRGRLQRRHGLRRPRGAALTGRCPLRSHVTPGSRRRAARALPGDQRPPGSG